MQKCFKVPTLDGPTQEALYLLSAFHIIKQKNDIDVSRIQIWIVGIEGKYDDQSTTTTFQIFALCDFKKCK